MHVKLTEAVRYRASRLEALGFKRLDAMHLACPEFGSADLFLTTDDRLLRRANRHASQLRVAVRNPATWGTPEERGS